MNPLYATIATVAVALCRGAVLLAPEFTVGPYRLAADPQGERFAVLDCAGEVCVFSEQWKAAYEVHGFVDYQTEFAPDYTAFGAAWAFVCLAGETAARDAIAEVHALLAAPCAEVAL